MAMLSINGGSMKDMKEASKRFHDELNNPKKRVIVCDTCGFESDDDWIRNEHFIEKGHARFTPKDYPKGKLGVEK